MTFVDRFLRSYYDQSLPPSVLGGGGTPAPPAPPPVEPPPPEPPPTTLATPVITALDPPSMPAGPPADTVLTVEGTDFTDGIQIAFGAIGGTPTWEAQAVFVDSTHVTLDITAGSFPNADPAVPVQVGYPPGGPFSNVVNFAFE